MHIGFSFLFNTSLMICFPSRCTVDFFSLPSPCIQNQDYRHVMRFSLCKNSLTVQWIGVKLSDLMNRSYGSALLQIHRSYRGIEGRPACLAICLLRPIPAYWILILAIIHILTITWPAGSGRHSIGKNYV